MPKNLVFLSTQNRFKSLRIDPWSIPGSPRGRPSTDSANPWSQGGGHLSKKKSTRNDVRDLTRRWAECPAKLSMYLMNYIVVHILSFMFILYLLRYVCFYILIGAIGFIKQPISKNSWWPGRRGHRRLCQLFVDPMVNIIARSTTRASTTQSERNRRPWNQM